jgi:pimeloyl-ACP methyl ester carboxylesterase
MNHRTYSPANIKPFAFTDPERHMDSMREATEQVIGISESGQRFSGIHVNRAFDGQGAAFVRINSLFGNTANADQQYIATQYAAAFPNRAYLSIDLPAHGASDGLTKEQRKAVKSPVGSVNKIAEAQVEAVLDMAPGLRTIVLTGEAMGELFAVEFAVQAAAKGMEVRRLFGFDPMGLEKRTPVALATGYLSNAQKSRAKRRKQSKIEGEQALEDAFSEDFLREAELYSQVKYATQPGHAKLLAKERTIGRLMFRKSPLTQDIGLQALEGALGAHPEMEVNLIFGGLSVIGRLNENVRNNLHAISWANGNRLHFEEWPDDNQDLGLAKNQPRLIQYIKDSVKI